MDAGGVWERRGDLSDFSDLAKGRAELNGGIEGDYPRVYSSNTLGLPGETNPKDFLHSRVSLGS